MDFTKLARSRSMTRAFLPDAVPPETLTQVLDLARRVPSAGNTQGFDFVVLTGPEQTQRYWDATLPAERRSSFAWPGLLQCPVLVTIWANQNAYTQRYAQSDKAATGLADAQAWSTPYWLVDASFAALAMQYAALDAGLGVLFFGMFEHAAAVKAALGVPADRVAVGTVAIGWSDPTGSTAGRSATRPRRPLGSPSQSDPDAVAHYASW